MKWIWPVGLLALWEDKPEEDDAYYKSMLKEIEDRYAALPEEERHKLINTGRAEELEREGASKAAKSFLSKNRKSLIDRFMNSDLVKYVYNSVTGYSTDNVRENKDKKERAMRAWLAKQLGRDNLGESSPMEKELAKYYSDSSRGMLGSLPAEAKDFIRRMAPILLASESALHSVAGVKSRDTQGYNPLLAVRPIENYEIAAKERELTSRLLANLHSGRGNVLDVIGGEVTVPGFADPSAWKGGRSLEDKVLDLLGDKFITSQFANDFEANTRYARGKQSWQAFAKQILRQQALKGGPTAGDPRFANQDGSPLAFDFNTNEVRPESDIAKDKADKEAAEQAERAAQAKQEQEQRAAADRAKSEFSAQLKQGVMNAQSELDKYYVSRDGFLRNLIPDYREVVEASEIETGNLNGAPLPEGWIDVYEYPIAVPYRGGMLVADFDGDAPRYISDKNEDYKKYKDAMLSTLQKMFEGVSGAASKDDLEQFKGIIELLGRDVSDSRMKKRKRRRGGMTNVGRLGSFLSSGMFRIGE